MFRSLRTKLVISHVAVIALAFLLTALGATVPVRRAQHERLDEALRASAEGAARQIDVTRQLAPQSGLLADETIVDVTRRLLETEARRAGVRLLVIDGSGTVMIDTALRNSYEGQALVQLDGARQELMQGLTAASPGARPAARLMLALDAISVSAGQIDGHRAVLAGTSASTIANRQPFFVVAISPTGSTPVIDDLIRPLLLAALIGTTASVLIALFLARSTTGPIRRLSATVGTMDAGDLDQRIRMNEGGEVGTLVDAFNGLLNRVATTYQSQRALLANIAHELRTPLTSIQGYAQALRDGMLTHEEDREAALATITDEAERMTSLVEQIMQLSRLESGQVPLAVQRTALDETLARVDRHFRAQAAESGINLSVGSDSELELDADPDLLYQALGNLVINAIRHTPAGGSIEVRAARLAGKTRQPAVRLTVSDTGEGIAADQLEHIFERFYRGGDGENRRSGRNFGLGLAIVHEIVERHAGQITVESAPGQGATFAIDLPLRQHPDQRRRAP